MTDRITYKGYRIIETFAYSINGKYVYSDFSVFPEEDEEGKIAFHKTLSEVKESIDELVLEVG